MKRFLLVGISFLTAITLTACSTKKENTQTKTETKSEAKTETVKDVNVLIKVKNYGDIKVHLYGKYAPLTVKNFTKLVNEKFYDGLTFHRIIKGFMIQGGDPNGDGSGGSDQTIKGEFSENGINNPLKHERGVISMARATSYDSASSQFFIMHQTNTSLDGQYAAFGKVTSGMSVVDKLANVSVEDSNGTVKASNQPVITSIRIVK